MKIYISLFICFGAILITAQNKGDAECEKQCDAQQTKCEADNLKPGKSVWEKQPCDINRITCHGTCISKGCIRKSGLAQYHEKCGCHGECINSHCENGVCCLPKGYGTNDTNQCCSKQGHHVPIDQGVNYECD